MIREELKELGLSDEQIDKVMASHGKVVNTTKQELETVTTERDNLKEQLTERDNQLNDLSDKLKDNDELTAEINRLKDENKTTKEQYEADLKDLTMTNAIKLALAGKVHDEDLASSLIDKEKLVVDGEKIVGLDEQIESLQESKSFLFKQEESSEPKPNFTTGQHQKGGTTKDISQMSYQELADLKANNPTKFAELTK